MLIKILAYVVMFSLLTLCGYTFYLLRKMHKHIEESEKELVALKNHRKRDGYDSTVAETVSKAGK